MSTTYKKEGTLMKKPNVGDKVTVALYIESMEFQDVPMEVTVTAVHDTLTESWGQYGELAVLQKDADDAVGLTGEWYIICVFEDGQASAASYEIVDAPSE